MTPTGEYGGGSGRGAGLDVTTDPDAGPRYNPAPGATGRHRFLIVACMVGGLGAFAIGAAIALNGRRTDMIPATSAGQPAGSVPVALRFPTTTATTKPRPTSTVTPTSFPAPAPTGATPTTGTGFVVTPPANGSGPAPPPPPTAIPPTTVTPTSILGPPATAVLPPLPPFGPEVLKWTAPKLVEVVEGQTATFTVSAHNPESRDVAMPHPLSCAPRIDGSELCADMVQLVAPHATVTQRYTIDATGIAPGHYTMRVEGVLKIAVTVAASTP